MKRITAIAAAIRFSLSKPLEIYGMGGYNNDVS